MTVALHALFGFILLVWLLGVLKILAVRRDPRWFQLSPARPSSWLSSPTSSTTRSSSAGRCTTITSVPLSAGAAFT